MPQDQENNFEPVSSLKCPQGSMDYTVAKAPITSLKIESEKIIIAN